MKEKGNLSDDEKRKFAESFLEKLRGLEDVSSKKMFGGYGLFHKGKMFGMITAKGGAYLKADDSNKEDYLALNSSKHSRMPYYEIPDEIFNNDKLLISWVQKSMDLVH